MPRNNPWSEDDLKYLRENHDNMTYAKIAKFLNRSRSSVSGKATYLGLRKTPKQSKSLVQWVEPKVKANAASKSINPKEKRQRYIAQWEARKLAQRGQYSKAAARTYHDRVQP